MKSYRLAQGLLWSQLALLGWRAERGLDAMCADAWRWQTSSSAANAPIQRGAGL
jgi:hypothetical protein